MRSRRSGRPTTMDATNLAELYDYMCRRLMKANSENRPEMLDEVSALLGDIRSAWIAIAPR